MFNPFEKSMLVVGAVIILSAFAAAIWAIVTAF